MTAAEVAKDTVIVGGHVAKAGDLICLVTITTDSRHGKVLFETPGPVSLSLNIAARASRIAAQLRTEIHFIPVKGNDTKNIAPGHLPKLFEYFEQFMVAVTFSFQSLEVFSNDVIFRHPTAKHIKKTRDGERDLTADEAEREFSTDHKLSRIVPTLLGRESPKGTALWERYRRLKAIRDTIIHLKSGDQYVRGRPDKSSLYFQFLTHDAREFPRTSLSLVKHFAGDAAETWIDVAERHLFPTP
jgi:hypothetical protein